MFDKVARHLLKQGKRSRTRLAHGAMSCAYRGRGGTSCAIGCLIPKSRYRRELEGQRADQPEVMEAARLEGEHLQLAVQLQFAHDQNEPRAWARELHRTA